MSNRLSAAGTQGPEWHLLAGGNHNSQDASPGINLSLGARSTLLYFKWSLSS